MIVRCSKWKSCSDATVCALATPHEGDEGLFKKTECKKEPIYMVTTHVKDPVFLQVQGLTTKEVAMSIFHLLRGIHTVDMDMQEGTCCIKIKKLEG